MIQITRILFIIYFFTSTSVLLFAHQAHNIKNENTSSSKESHGILTTQIKEKINDPKICELDNNLKLECCCINKVCFQSDNRCDCCTDKVPSEISCQRHCGDENFNDNNLINQNVKTQYSYRIFFLNNFLPIKNSGNKNHNSPQKSITQSIPAYISIHSFLI